MVVSAQTCGRPPIPRLLVVSWRVHVFQDQFARLDLVPFARVNEVHAKFLDGVRNFRTPRASAAAIAAPHSRRYTAASGSIPRSVLGMTASPRDSSARESSQSSHFCRKVRQGRRRRSNSSASALRSGRRRFLPEAHARVCPARPEPARRPRLRTIRASRIYWEIRQLLLGATIGSSNRAICRISGDAPEIEESLIATHARAGASRKNESSDIAIAFHDCPLILRLRMGLAQPSGGL